MASLTPTTPDEIEDDFIELLHGLTPRIMFHKDSKYVHYERKANPSTRARRFTIRWADERTNFEGIMGKNLEEVEADMSIFVDYGGVPEQTVDKVAGDDHRQIEDRLQSRKDPTLPGLMWIESLGYAATDAINEGDQEQFEHLYLVRWIAARAT